MAEEEVKKVAGTTEEEEGGDAEGAEPGDEEDTGGHFAPIVQLAEINVTSGEEDEDVLFKIKSKLYRFDRDKGEWKERGVGDCKLLQHKANKKVRLLMRRERTLKICANHIAAPGIKLQEHAGSDKSWVWSTVDFADGVRSDELFAMRFGSVESAQKFQKAFLEAQEINLKIIGAGDVRDEGENEEEDDDEEEEEDADEEDEDEDEDEEDTEEAKPKKESDTATAAKADEAADALGGLSVAADAKPAS